MPFDESGDWLAAVERASEILYDFSSEEMTEDRKRLWALLRFISINAPMTNAWRDVEKSLSRYLHSTCRHSMQTYNPKPDDDIPRHRQCSWCNEVEWDEDDAERRGT